MPTPTSGPAHGALYLDEGNTRFALWAPSAKSVELVFAGGSTQALHKQADGWFRRDLPCPLGSAYAFRIDGEQQVPDPASRAQQDSVHGFSLLQDASRYSWQNPQWQGRPWHETVLYEVHVGLFGGYAGVEQQLADWRELGITAIELMPLGQFPGTRNWGYDGVLPFAPQNSYGSPDQLRQLIDSAHGLGLMVFIDVVYNHFGPDGNYLGLYAKDFFRDDISTPWGPAIDFRRPPVRDFFIENALMWVQDYRVDGLRFDAVHAISEKDFLVEMAQRLRAAVPLERHLHLVLENEDNSAELLQAGFDAQWNDDGHNALHVLLTGEHEGYYRDYAQQPTEKLARCLQQGFVYQGQTNRHGHARGEPSGHLPPTAFVLFLQNHDQVGNRAFGERLSCLADPDALKAATVLLLLSPMIPLLFMGEEWGSRQAFLFFTDHHDELGIAVRDGRRNEFGEFAVFQDSAIRDSIPDPNKLGTFNSSLPDYAPDIEPSHQAWRIYYRKLLELRQQLIVPRLPGSHAGYVQVLGDKALSANWTLADGSKLRIDLNLSDQAVTAPPLGSAARVVFGNRIDLHAAQQGLRGPFSALASIEESA
ncbi:maltooligosyltrehalose trehalohydrolase [Pseudomonas sp. TE3786]